MVTASVSPFHRLACHEALLDVEGARQARRIFARACLDWTETRAVRVSEMGRLDLGKWLGVEVQEAVRLP